MENAPAPSQRVLESLGLDDARLAEAEALGGIGALGRVNRVDRGMATVVTEAGPLRVDNPTNDALIVGDWAVVIDGVPTRLERRTELVRRTGYRRDERQAIAANVDLVLVVRALDTAVRLNRLSTLVVIAYDSGAVPLVVLTKADLDPDPAAACQQVATGLGGVETMAISTVTGAGIDELRARVAGRTIVLLGESGAGKSTLTNALAEAQHLATADVRRDGQGRHTTTHRELVVLPTGGVVIDTPGIRDAASFGEGAGLELTFADVVELALRCRFSDCAHGPTPGCAITPAIEDGTIDQARVEAYLHEVAEQAWLERRHDLRAQSEAKANPKRLTKAMRSRRREDP